jgi:hypothetical protein
MRHDAPVGRGAMCKPCLPVLFHNRPPSRAYDRETVPLSLLPRPGASRRTDPIGGNAPIERWLSTYGCACLCFCAGVRRRRPASTRRENPDLAQIRTALRAREGWQPADRIPAAPADRVRHASPPQSHDQPDGRSSGDDEQQEKDPGTDVHGRPTGIVHEFSPHQDKPPSSEQALIPKSRWSWATAPPPLTGSDSQDFPFIRP